MQVEERELVPFEATPLRGERLLVLAPHPDDEVIGCGGLVAQHAAEQRQVRVIVATDGSAAASDSDEAYVAKREAESRAGLAQLGVAAVEFLRFRDRQLHESPDALRSAIADALRQFKPDLIAVTSPLELHPDHVALSRAVVDAIQSDPAIAASLPLTRVAFYEVSQPIRPNTLVDITAVGAMKRAALSEHHSQIALRGYERFTRGLNAYRTMTLAPEVEEAEGYWVVDMATLARSGWSEIARAMAPQPRVTVTRELPSVATIIRTRNRLELLREAVDSVQDNSVRGELIIVNDGGESPREIAATAAAKCIDLPENVGRAEAMNRGVAATSAEMLTFLDDDDRFYSDHIETLLTAASRERRAAWYSDAVSTFVERADDGSWREAKRLTLYASDFDDALLYVDNFIPLISLCVRREDYVACGGFDPEFDLFEDWDFLLRLHKHSGAFVRIPRITSEIRHFPASGSLAMEASADVDRLARGKEAIWRRHPEALEPGRLTRAIELQKRRMASAATRAVDESGRAGHLELDVVRLSREKELLIREIGRITHAHEADISLARADLSRLEQAVAELNQELERHRAAIFSLQQHLDESSAALEAHRVDQRSKNELIERLYAEIARLNAILDTIYASRSWKLHRFVERLSGRG